MIDDFIGQRFGKNEHLEVIGWDGISRNNYERDDRYGSKLYSVRCSICCKDPELFGEGVFLACKGNLISGAIPCGCARNVKWSYAQYCIKAKRIIEKLGYSLVKMYENTEDPRSSIVEMRCEKHSLNFKRNMQTVIQKQVICKKCSVENFNEQSEQRLILKFTSTGAFAEGTSFKRSDRIDSKGCKSFWIYRCPVCSEDEYVRNGLCDGNFEAFCGTLAAGGLSCRCSKRFLWTKEQREYQIKTRLIEENSKLRFVGWKDVYHGLKSIFMLECEIHGVKEIELGKFLARNRRCVSCTKKGLDLSKPTSFYVLKIAGDLNFTGYGISTSLKDRLCTHRRNLKKFNSVIDDMEIFNLDGDLALKIEAKLKNVFRKFDCEIEGFRTESTDAYNYLDVISLTENIIKENYETSLSM